MSDKRVWHVMPDPKRPASPTKADNLKVYFQWHGRPAEEFTQSELRATIQILRHQGKPTGDYEEGLAGLLELEGVK
jgi:hypothetical protein